MCAQKLYIHCIKSIKEENVKTRDNIGIAVNELTAQTSQLTENYEAQ